MPGTIYPLEKDNEMTPKPSNQQIEDLYHQQEPAAQRLLMVRSTAPQEGTTTNRRIRWSLAELGPNSKDCRSRESTCMLEDPFTTRQSGLGCAKSFSTLDTLEDPFISRYDSSEDSLEDACGIRETYHNTGYVSRDHKVSSDDECKVEENDDTLDLCRDLQVRDNV